MKGTTSVGLRSLMGLRTSYYRTDSQSIKLSALMAAIIIYAFSRLAGNLSVSSKLAEQRCSCGVLGVLALLLAPAMPRLRGKPRRGAGWYAADSRRKRHRKFQRAVSMAKQRRRRVNTVASSPPRTFVEEDPDMELPPDFSESRMFIVPDNWDPPTCIAEAEALPRSTRHLRSLRSTKRRAHHLRGRGGATERHHRIADKQGGAGTSGNKRQAADAALATSPAPGASAVDI
jgi:hypothetical protein